MASIPALYNTLPNLEAAERRFAGKRSILAELGPLLAAYDNQFGVCLVHAHCTLADDEIMVADGNVAKPETDGPYYPERWLATGVPYEFRHQSVPTPPPNLFTEFRKLVGHDDILGLFYAGDIESGTMLLERTVGRANITDQVTDVVGHMETGWLPGSKNPIVMACTIWCDSRTTRSGNATHKGTTSHKSE